MEVSRNHEPAALADPPASAQGLAVYTAVTDDPARGYNAMLGGVQPVSSANTARIE